VQGRAAIQPHSTSAVTRLGRRRRQPRPSFVPGTLCCAAEGFSLHANVLVPEDRREQLEHLCRYVTRPPIATQRLSLAPDGRVVYGLKRHWRDGTSAVSFDPLTFIERLASLVPRPRCHLLTYHGILAPAAQWRDQVVPASRDSAEHVPLAIHSASRRATWAELLQRVFAIDALTCPHCGGKRKLIALITQASIVRRILAHLRLPTEPPALAPARAPPESAELAFDA